MSGLTFYKLKQYLDREKSNYQLIGINNAFILLILFRFWVQLIKLFLDEEQERQRGKGLQNSFFYS